MRLIYSREVDKKTGRHAQYIGRQVDSNLVRQQTGIGSLTVKQVYKYAYVVNKKVDMYTCRHVDMQTCSQVTGRLLYN